VVASFSLGLRALVHVSSVITQAYLRFQLCNESSHRFTSALFTGVVAASSNLRQEIGTYKIISRQSYSFHTGTSILQTFSSFKHDFIVHQIHNNSNNSHGNHYTGFETMEPLEERDDQQLRELEAKSGFSILCHSTLTSLHFSPTVPLGPLRGFTDDGETVSLARRKTARQKVNFLEVMRGQIANYCPVISRNTLLKNSTSIQSVWLPNHRSSLPGFCKPTSGS